MTRPIDAESLKRHFVTDTPLIVYDFVRGINIMIDNEPTLDVVPVRHGKWIDIDEQTYTWKIRCSCCGNERSMLSTQGKYPNYCEACGARMDGDNVE